MKLETKSLIFYKPQNNSIFYGSICDSTMVTVALVIIHVTSLLDDVTGFKFYTISKVACQVFPQISHRTQLIEACDRMFRKMPGWHLRRSAGAVRDKKQLIPHKLTSVKMFQYGTS